MPTHFQGTSEEQRALNAYINFQRAAESCSARVHQHLGAFGLTETQFGVLECLFHLGPQCQKALADKLLKSGGNITLVIDNLQKSQLVERVRNPKDRRYITVELTDKGRSLMQEVFPRHAAIITDLMSILSEDEQLQMRSLCRILGRQSREGSN